MVGNELLLADYPEAIYPIRCLEGEARRCTGQRYYGIPTRVGWGVDELICPTVPGSRCSGSIIRVSGLTGNIRGALHVRADGTQVRPTLVVCDDPQTYQSVRSLLQTAERLAIINGAIKGLAGPGQRTAIVIPCTVIQGGDLADQLLDRQKNPSWHGERTKLVYSFPVADKLWGEYAASTGRKAWTPDQDQRGLVCRSCGCQHFRVVYTRPTWNGRIMRRRECRHCGKRMTTWERAGG